MHDAVGEERRHRRCPRGIDHEKVRLVGLLQQPASLAAADHPQLHLVVRAQHLGDLALELGLLVGVQLRRILLDVR